MAYNVSDFIIEFSILRRTYKNRLSAIKTIMEGGGKPVRWYLRRVRIDIILGDILGEIYVKRSFELTEQRCMVTETTLEGRQVISAKAIYSFEHSMRENSWLSPIGPLLTPFPRGFLRKINAKTFGYTPKIESGYDKKSKVQRTLTV